MIGGWTRFLLRATLALGSIVVALAVALAAALLFAFGTKTGSDLVRAETEAAVNQLVGSGYEVNFRRQGLTLSASGDLVLHWYDVELHGNRSNGPTYAVERIEAELSLLPLLSGSAEVRSLVVSGAHVRLGGTDGSPASAEIRPSTSTFRSDGAAELLDAVERQLEQLRAQPIRSVSVTDVTIAGWSFGSKEPRTLEVKRAELHRSHDGGLDLAGEIQIDGTSLQLTGQAVFDPDSPDLRRVELRSQGPLAATIAPEPSPPRFETLKDVPESESGIRLAIDFPEKKAARQIRVAATIGPRTIALGSDRIELSSAELNARWSAGDDELILDPSELSFDGLEVEFGGRIVPVMLGSTTGLPERFHFSLQSPLMRSTVARPVDAALTLAGSLDLGTRKLVLSEFNLASGRGSLIGTGTLGLGGEEDATSLRLTASDLPVPSVKAFWPFFIAPDVRDWVLENAGDVGVVWAGAINLDLPFERLRSVVVENADLRAKEFRLDVAIDGADFATADDLPALSGASGRVETRGTETMVHVDSAQVSGYPSASVRPSSIRFTDQPSGGTKTDLELHLTGEAASLLAISAREPVSALDHMEFGPADVSGLAAAHIKASFLLGDEIAESDRLLSWTVEAEVEDGAILKPIEGRLVSSLHGSLSIEPGQASGTLEGKIDGFPAKVSFARPFGSADPGSEALAVDLSLSANDVAEAFPDLGNVVQGPISAKITREAAGLRAELDLSGAKLTIPGVGWTKGGGIPATLSFVLASSSDGTLLKDVTLAGKGFAATGEVSLGTDGLRSARFDQLALNPGDDISLAVDRVSNGYSIRATGASFDARPFLSSIRAALTSASSDAGSLPKSQFDISVSLDRVTGFGRETIQHVVLNYAGRGNDIAAFSLQAETGAGAPLTVDVSPRGSERSIGLGAGNMGAVLRFTDLYGRMEGGSGSLKLKGSRDSPYRGRLVLRDFTLIDEPRLSSLVGAQPSSDRPSLSDALRTPVTTERAFFDQALAELSYDSRSLKVEDGILRGPIFGSSFEGTIYDARERIDVSGSFMPAYGINRLFGAIPLLGRILGNGDEGGLIGITYRLSGAFTSPTLTVNPISAIAPGIFRQIFAYQ